MSYLVKDVRREIYSQITDAQFLDKLTSQLDDIEVIYLLNSITHLTSGQLSVELLKRLPRLISIWDQASLVINDVDDISDFYYLVEKGRFKGIKRLRITGMPLTSALHTLLPSYWEVGKSLEIRNENSSIRLNQGSLELRGEEAIEFFVIRQLSSYLGNDYLRTLRLSESPQLIPLPNLLTWIGEQKFLENLILGPGLNLSWANSLLRNLPISVKEIESDIYYFDLLVFSPLLNPPFLGVQTLVLTSIVLPFDDGEATAQELEIRLRTLALLYPNIRDIILPETSVQLPKIGKLKIRSLPNLK